MKLSRRCALVAGVVSGVLLGGLVVAPAAVPAPTQPAPGVKALCNQDVPAGHFACLGLEGAGATPMHTDPLSNWFGPTEIQSAYNLPAAPTGSGQTVWIIDAYDNPNAEADLAVYRSHYGLPECSTANGCFKKLNQNGDPWSYPLPDLGWGAEIALDLQMVSAACPSCNIRLVEAYDAGDSLFTAISTAVRLGAKFVSLSWGAGESHWDTLYNHYLDVPGVVFAVASGDSGYAAGPMYPASSPYVVAVGGTHLDGSPATGWSESAWGSPTGGSGAGSGCSDYETKPVWQTVPGAVCAKRALADVSVVADPQTGVAVYNSFFGGGWVRYGGTSAGAPIIASVYALAGTPGAADRPARYLYEATSGLHDVVGGSTGVCTVTALCVAGVGWDGPTGLGSPNGVSAFRGNPGTVAVGNPGTRSAQRGVAVRQPMYAYSTNLLPLTFSATGLPPGLRISTGGVVSGAPTATGTFTTTVTARDTSGASGSVTFAWVVTLQSCPSRQVLSNPSFEPGLAPFVASAGVLHTDRDALAGRRYANLGGWGRTHVDTLARRTAVPAGCSASLMYWLRVRTDDRSGRVHDTMTVYVNGRAVKRFSNVNWSRYYHAYRIDLTPYAGTKVVVTWKSAENASLRTSFQIDVVGLWITARR